MKNVFSLVFELEQNQAAMCALKSAMIKMSLKVLKTKVKSVIGGGVAGRG